MSTADARRYVPDLIPARMLNEFAYCPRLSWLEWSDGDFADSADTIEGKHHHRRVDKEAGPLPAPSEIAATEKIHARSVYLSAPIVGLIAKIDLVECDGGAVTPVDYKRGKAPDIPEGAWEPERVQICAQALILEENGYICTEGVLYFAGSRRRVPVVITAELRARTKELLAAMRDTMAGSNIPPPLVDSPKCPRCSLVAICLPDEINLLRIEATGDVPLRSPITARPVVEPRRLVPASDDGLPLYVQAQGARIGKRAQELVVEQRDGSSQTCRLGQTSQISLFGNVQISTQAIQAAIGEQIPVCYFSGGGWFYGMTTGLPHKNVELRRRQYRTADSEEAALSLARAFVVSKIRNSRTILRRNAEALPDQALDSLKVFSEQADSASSLASLLGIEGTAARVYYEHFSRMLKQVDGEGVLAFDFNGRNRRPPRDPVNALLSLAYSLLAKDFAVVLHVVGFDPLLGFYHQPRYGRPALALDLMEELRPIVADSVVIGAINTGVVRPSDFVTRGGAVSLTQSARTRFMNAYERRMADEVTHPIFGYRISYRRVLEVQARLLARFLGGEIPRYPGFETR